MNDSLMEISKYTISPETEDELRLLVYCALSDAKQGEEKEYVIFTLETLVYINNIAEALTDVFGDSMFFNKNGEYISDQNAFEICDNILKILIHYKGTMVLFGYLDSIFGGNMIFEVMSRIEVESIKIRKKIANELTFDFILLDMFNIDTYRMDVLVKRKK